MNSTAQCTADRALQMLPRVYIVDARHFVLSSYSHKYIVGKPGKVHTYSFYCMQHSNGEACYDYRHDALLACISTSCMCINNSIQQGLSSLGSLEASKHNINHEIGKQHMGNLPTLTTRTGARLIKRPKPTWVTLPPLSGR